MWEPGLPAMGIGICKLQLTLKPQEIKLLWRAGLPALGCEAAPKPNSAEYLVHRIPLTGAAAQPNAGKPARHRKIRQPVNVV
ncbi:hypothetical protein BFW87_28905 [Pseudomonas fluorescens]|uniref:Uncharacterized protein n=1 Tax=Pseudomonas fluorescens TaxID=294 RepID=A0A1T2XXC7_PSEFL|nr:hypothetical protein BFW87_28905 [Pseudomonas fluorescens]